MEADVDKHILTLKLMGINFCNPFLLMRCRPYVAHIPRTDKMEEKTKKLTVRKIVIDTVNAPPFCRSNLIWFPLLPYYIWIDSTFIYRSSIICTNHTCFGIYFRFVYKSNTLVEVVATCYGIILCSRDHGGKLYKQITLPNWKPLNQKALLLTALMGKVRKVLLTTKKKFSFFK